VIVPAQAVRVVIATKPVDFHKGHDGLAALAQNELGLDPHSGLIVFGAALEPVARSRLTPLEARRQDQGAGLGRQRAGAGLQAPGGGQVRLAGRQ
jgi:hypothetical protein